MKVLSVVGARPQFVKEFAVTRALRDDHEEVLLHTGQHYDAEMSAVFFDELGIPEPDYQLGVGSDTHGRQTADCVVGIEEVIEAEEPDAVLVYGDTNSTLGAAIAASKSSADLVHVESGLRSYNREMPEEVNRVLTDHAADVLFAPSERAAETLQGEGLPDERIHVVGDVQYDAILAAREHARDASTILDDLALPPGEFVLATVHRPRNTDDPDRLTAILDALADAEREVVVPVHPRTEQRLQDLGLRSEYAAELRLVDPVGYLDFVRLLDAAARVATDSGGVQKEAFFLDTFCLTLREETEWVETVECGWNALVDADPDRIATGLTAPKPDGSKPSLYGDGTAATRIVDVLEDGPTPERVEPSPIRDQ
ncbi:non-hydrolyzing UDP-N-acetylglucosamine 2-epimerase [Halosimplex pelagicum]|uniref:UDP-N-acetylglucosamine 2-epimerase (Non-hydrolyzing) n=1 Tax=Halosimplex pelagicum TaxID=869886 RepID=A0A7D5PA13_9EURY|nr:UDP-N-acetylglucosamine 2-epimerase (non-hydrolyzing) [Halosimplex pelagicum]QLH81182.1 UDP-N-acetylglucosamine 2-epimerase (non-hydrolyzing) [Halosimplex pelagicum]